MIAIFWGTIRYSENQQSRFEEGLGDGDEVSHMSFLQFGEEDSVSVSRHKGSPVILDFWATWSQRSAQAHGKLAELQRDHPELVIISVAVKDDEEYISQYISENNYNFIFADGTQAYQDLLVPGLPTQLMFDAKGKLKHVLVGFKDEDQFEEILTNAQ
ncbi:MAG: TlpA disulfide reductase family protein [Balneolales bacterium]